MDQQLANFLDSPWLADRYAWFARLDANGDGFVDVADLRAFHNEVGLISDEGAIWASVARFAPGNGDRFDRGDYVAGVVLQHRNSHTGARTLWTAFSALDRDGDGRISVDELHHWYAERGVALSEEEVVDRMVSFDLDGDGRISFKEFVRMLLG